MGAARAAVGKRLQYKPVMKPVSDGGGGARRVRGALEGEWDDPVEWRKVSPGSVYGSSGWRAGDVHKYQ